MQLDRRKPVVIVSGWGQDTEFVASRHLTPGVAVVHHKLAQLNEGVVVRTLRTAAETRTEVLELAHGCVSCTLREDLLPLLRRLAQRSNVTRIVLALDPVLEPETVCWAIANVVVAGVVGQIDGPAGRDVRVEAVVTCLDADTWFDDATCDDAITDRGIFAGNDERTVAQVVVGQAEFADALIVTGDADPFSRARLEAVFARLAPRAITDWHATTNTVDVAALLERLPATARRGRVDDVHAPLLQGEPPLTTELGIGLVEFTAERPFHPQRLHEAIDVLLTGVIRVRGRLWIAGHADRVVQIESAGGGLRVGDAGLWLAAMTPDQRERQPALRRTMAALRWHPRFGDRDISIVALVHSADPSEIERTLRWALLTDEELNLEHRWSSWADPFGTWHQDPCEDLESPHVNTERKDQA